MCGGRGQAIEHQIETLRGVEGSREGNWGAGVVSRQQGSVQENRKTVGVSAGDYFTQVGMGQRVYGVTTHKNWVDCKRRTRDGRYLKSLGAVSVIRITSLDIRSGQEV